jgi:hypothetical protein
MAGAVVPSAASWRNHARIVDGRTIWQLTSRSVGVSALPLIASRRRWSGVKRIRVLPVASARTSRGTRTSSWRYSTRFDIRSLIAHASIETMNWTVSGSIEAPIPCPVLR